MGEMTNIPWCDSTINFWGKGAPRRKEFADWLSAWLRGKPPQNIWLLASVENQAAADERIPHLLNIPANIPAVVRGLSCEPLLGPIDLRFKLQPSNPAVVEYQRRAIRSHLQWVIIGGESGPKARPCNVEWIRSIKDQCRSAGVPCFVKQLGSNCVANNKLGFPDGTDFYPSQRGPIRMILHHPKGGDPTEWPEDLRVRQFPEARRC